MKIEGVSRQTCIYCLEEKELSAFNEDHILPEAFGRFREGLPRLTCVCRACNQDLGDKIELIFHRGSLEAIHRILKGLKSPHEVGELLRKRLSFTVAAPGDWYGVRLEFQVEEGSPVVAPLPQVGFLPKGQSGWIYMTDSELADSSKHLPDDIDKIKLFAPSDAVQEYLIGLLTERGIPFHKQGELSPPPSEGMSVLVDHHFSVDLFTRRSVAKIAFNYLTHVAGQEFVLRPCFNDVRSFIRWGIVPAYHMVHVSCRPILFDDLPTQRQTDGHLLTLEWPWLGSQDYIIGRVSIFNLFTYTVLLTRKCSGIWRDIRQGHHFDIAENRVTRLFKTPLVLPAYIKQRLTRAESLARPRISMLYDRRAPHGFHGYHL